MAVGLGVGAGVGLGVGTGVGTAVGTTVGTGVGMGMNVGGGATVEVGHDVGLGVDAGAGGSAAVAGLGALVPRLIAWALTGEVGNLDTEKPPAATASSAPTPSSVTFTRRVIDVTLKGSLMPDSLPVSRSLSCRFRAPSHLGRSP